MMSSSRWVEMCKSVIKASWQTWDWDAWFTSNKIKTAKRINIRIQIKNFFFNKKEKKSKIFLKNINKRVWDFFFYSSDSAFIFPIKTNWDIRQVHFLHWCTQIPLNWTKAFICWPPDKTKSLSVNPLQYILISTLNREESVLSDTTTSVETIR